MAMPHAATTVAAPAAQEKSAAGGAGAAAAEKPAEKVEFTLKLDKFDATAKAKVIREMKNILPGATLVDAKKFVESAPKVIREHVPKEEAEKIKKALEAVGAVVLME